MPGFVCYNCVEKMEGGGEDRIEAFYLFIWTSINGLLLLLLVDGFLATFPHTLCGLIVNTPMPAP